MKEYKLQYVETKIIREETKNKFLLLSFLKISIVVVPVILAIQFKFISLNNKFKYFSKSFL